MDCPYAFMPDMVAGTFRLPWEDKIEITDGTLCGFPAPTRMFGKTAKAAEGPLISNRRCEPIHVRP